MVGGFPVWGNAWMRERFKAKGGTTFNKFVKILGYMKRTTKKKKKKKKTEVSIKDPILVMFINENQ